MSRLSQSTDLLGLAEQLENEPAASRRDFLGALVLLTGSTGWLVGCDNDADRSEPIAGVAEASAGELPDQLWRAGAGQLAAAIASGEVSSVEVMEAHLARIEEVNPQLNAIVRVLADEGLAAARRADGARAAGSSLGRLHGVPVSIKENVDVAGAPTTSGVDAFRDAVAPQDAPVVERLRAAGAIPFARTNLPDLGLRVHTSSGLHGLTRNPWALDRNVGGSSGGEAASLASGMSPLGIGNDIGGSLRIPAQCCGIASLKPTFGRVPSASSLSNEGSSMSGQLMAVEGPMARTVADVRTGFEVIAGPHLRDPWSMPVPLELERPATPISVALVAQPSGGRTHPDVAAGVRKAGETLADAGYRVEEIEPPRLEDARRVWGQLLASELAVSLPDLREILAPDSYRFLEIGLPILAPGDFGVYSRALAERQSIAAAWEEFQHRYPLIVGPILTEPPFEIGYDLEHPDQVLEQMRFEVVINLLGLPAACVPVGVAQELPQVVEIIGGRYREDLCLEAAQVIENTVGILTPIDPVA